MTYYYNPETGQYAKVLSLDEADFVIVMINDEHDEQYRMVWQGFLKKFNSLCSVRSSDE